jgi:hypothetical protein
MDVWKTHRGVRRDNAHMVENLAALLFNVMGYMYEELREMQMRAAEELVLFDGYRVGDVVQAVAVGNNSEGYGRGGIGVVRKVHSGLGELVVHFDGLDTYRLVNESDVRLFGREHDAGRGDG